MRAHGPKPYLPPNCPGCGKLTKRTGQRSRKGMRFECLNPKCNVIEVRIHNHTNRVIRTAGEGL